MNSDETARNYDRIYTTPNFFHDRRWLFKPFVSALVRAAGLRAGSTVLDAGCGQGFFTSLFAESGCDALGIDLSSVGIAAAQHAHSASGARFETGDILNLPYCARFDCVFSRSCSLYNAPDFVSDTSVTDKLLQCVKPGGILIIDYYTRLQKSLRSKNWLYHDTGDALRHVSKYPHAEVRFTTRLECRVLGRLSFSPMVSAIASNISRRTGIGGELIAFIRA